MSGDILPPRKGQPRPPEFFVDRCIPQRGAALLHERGWIVHSIRDYFPADAQYTPDHEWLDLALVNGWVGLTQDRRLWIQSSQMLPVFCLSDGNLSIAERARWFIEAEAQIMRLASHYKPGMWMVSEPPKRVRRLY